MSKKLRRKKNEDDSEESGEEDQEDAGSNDSEGSEEESESEDEKKGGAHGLIEIENPNRIQKKQVLKVANLDIESVASGSASSTAAAAPKAPVELSRREREEIEKQKKQANYQKLHAQGKTEQARADLARLAIIKQQREEAALQRELKKKQTEAKTGKAAK